MHGAGLTHVRVRTGRDGDPFAVVIGVGVKNE